MMMSSRQPDKTANIMMITRSVCVVMVVAAPTPNVTMATAASFLGGDASSSALMNKLMTSLSPIVSRFPTKYRSPSGVMENSLKDNNNIHICVCGRARAHLCVIE